MTKAVFESAQTEINRDISLSDRWIEAAVHHLTSSRKPLGSTYRLQFHTKFTFHDAIKIVPYLRELGVTHCYCSPYFKARPGSTHGYDVVDHAVLNPELGTEQDYSEWLGTLRDHDLGQIVDVVPNHMGVIGNENLWWNDVLENGQTSFYAQYFDISWTGSPRPEMFGRVLLPVLGEPYGEALGQGLLTLVFEDHWFSVHYRDHKFPVDPRSLEPVLSLNLEQLNEHLSQDDPEFLEYLSILTAITHLPDHRETDLRKVLERRREKEIIKGRFRTLMNRSDGVLTFVKQNVDWTNHSCGQSANLELLDNLLVTQPYRLCYWRVASDEINYRRFFDINDLAAISMERDEVFDAAHDAVLTLVAEGKVDGLRIDHPDGLYDPAAYFHRLQESCLLAHACAVQGELGATCPGGDEGLDKQLRERVRAALADDRNDLPRSLTHVVVEKILGRDESLRQEWPVSGTSGYDFVNVINGLFVDRRHEKNFSEFYEELLAGKSSFDDVAYQARRRILEISLASELHMLAHQLDRYAQGMYTSRDFTLNGLRQALTEVIACFPVYRSYITAEAIHPDDRNHVEQAVEESQRRNPLISSALFSYVREVLLGEVRDDGDPKRQEERLRFVGKFQQVTSPVSAKGIEDTAFYIYNRLVSLNEVGGDPSRFGLPPQDVHQYLDNRRKLWPRAMSPLSTHDTKRSEDVRARINVLSEMPDDWKNCVKRWMEMNQEHRIRLTDASIPDKNEEYLIYQTLIGSWPLSQTSSSDSQNYLERVRAYVKKAIREAKVHSNWAAPNLEYEHAVDQFVLRILDPTGSGFIDDFLPFQQRISQLGLYNSLSQTVIRLTAPGVPDTYQGTEFWDFSLVDPDNRRPVDFEARSAMLTDLKTRLAEESANPGRLAQELFEARNDGRIKLYLTWKILSLRRGFHDLLVHGDYVPLSIDGPNCRHVFAFERRHRSLSMLVVTPRLLSELVPSAENTPLGSIWQGTKVFLPNQPADISEVVYQNRFTGETLTSPVGNGALDLEDIFATWPVAVLLRDDHKPMAGPSSE